jgi:hypothetical protein
MALIERGKWAFGRLGPLVEEIWLASRLLTRACCLVNRFLNASNRGLSTVPRTSSSSSFAKTVEESNRQIVENDTDTLGLGKVNVSKFAHAGGEIDCGPALGDFHLAPRPMDVDEHEQIGCSITSIFAIVPLELARLGRDRRANLADELGRALVEANHWPVRMLAQAPLPDTSSVLPGARAGAPAGAAARQAGLP